MTFRNIAAAAAALTLAASPAIAQAERASAPAEETAEMGGSSLILSGIILLALLVVSYHRVKGRRASSVS